MKDLVSVYYFLEKPLCKVARVLLFFLLLTFVSLALMYGFSLKLPLLFLLLGIMAETFFHFKLAVLYPTHKLADKPTDMLTAATMPVLALYMITSPKSFVSFMISQEEIRFFLSRMLTHKTEILAIQIDKEVLFAKAAEYASQTHTNYIDTPHLFAAYLVLSEPQTHVLFTKKLKEIDLLRLIVWTSLTFPKRQEEKKHFQVIGEGYGEALVHGWTYETKKYTTDWTTEALRTQPHMFGVTDVFEQMIGVLSQPQHNNVLLIGEAGGGKHMLIDKLAFESYNGHVPPNLQHKRVLSLITSSLLAGTTSPADLEQRLQLVLGELAHADVLIAIPQLQDIVGSSTYHIDLSGTLLPYLEHGVTPIIATTTANNYKKHIEHSALKDFFTPIVIKEPEGETLFGMLFMAVRALEERQRMHFSYLAVKKATELAGRFDTIGVLPGSAAKLLEATGTAMLVKGSNIITDEEVTSFVEQTTHIPLSQPKEEEKQLLMHLEEVLHQKVIGQEIAITAISQGMRRLREGLSSTKKPISFLFLGPTGVGKTETAKALADIYYHGQAHMLRFDMSEYSGPDGLKRLLGAAPGEGDENGELTEKVFDNPSSLILLDEFEKAHPVILDLFLQVLDDGRLTDNKGKTVSFTNSIIIATSNAGSEFIRQHITQNKQIDQTFHQELLGELQRTHIFKPELLNRFDDVIVFKPLEHTQVITITNVLLHSLIKKLAEEDITLSFDPAVIEKIANESFDPSLGARPIYRYIQSTIEDLIARKKLEGTLSRGTQGNFVIDQTGQITLYVQS